MPSDQQTQTLARKKPLCRNEIAPIGVSGGGEKASEPRESRSDGDRLEGRAGGLVRGDGVLVAQGEPDVVEALHEPPAAEIVDREAPDGVVHTHLPGAQV